MRFLKRAAAKPRPFAARFAPRSGQRRMSVNFEELDFRPTPMGVLSLRRRRSLTSGLDIFEIKLGDEFLMSSQFTAAEIELARLGLAALDANRSRCRRRRPRARLHRAGGAGKSGRAIADRGRRAGRGDRMARAGLAAARPATDRRSALPPGQRRLLRDVAFGRGFRSRRAGPPLRCGAGGYRSLAAKPAASAPRRAVPAGGACAARRASQSRRRLCAVVERPAGRGVRRACWPAPSQPRRRMS